MACFSPVTFSSLCARSEVSAARALLSASRSWEEEFSRDFVSSNIVRASVSWDFTSCFSCSAAERADSWTKGNLLKCKNICSQQFTFFLSQILQCCLRQYKHSLECTASVTISILQAQQMATALSSSRKYIRLHAPHTCYCREYVHDNTKHVFGGNNLYWKEWSTSTLPCQQAASSDLYISSAVVTIFLLAPYRVFLAVPASLSLKQSQPWPVISAKKVCLVKINNSLHSHDRPILFYIIGGPFFKTRNKTTMGWFKIKSDMGWSEMGLSGIWFAKMQLFPHHPLCTSFFLCMHARACACCSTCSQHCVPISICGSMCLSLLAFK